MPGEAIRITLLVTDLFEQMGIRYAIGGSLSSSLHGVMRSTLDVDIIAELRPEHVHPLATALATEFYADDEMMRGAIEHHSSFNLVHYETGFKVDVFIPKPRNFDQQQLARRSLALLCAEPPLNAYITSAEDIILSKLEWYQMGGEVSDRQWRDILGVLKTKTGQLDLIYLRLAALELGVTELFERAISAVTGKGS